MDFLVDVEYLREINRINFRYKKDIEKIESGKVNVKVKSRIFSAVISMRE